MRTSKLFASMARGSKKWARKSNLNPGFDPRSAAVRVTLHDPKIADVLYQLAERLHTRDLEQLVP